MNKFILIAVVIGLACF